MTLIKCKMQNAECRMQNFGNAGTITELSPDFVARMLEEYKKGLKK